MGSKFYLKNKQFFLAGFYFALILFFAASCAKIGQPIGGPKDEDPPKILISEPANYTVNFNQQKIEVTFNEFIILKDLNKELFISPPLKEKPVIKIKNKTLVIDINNELRDSTTYTLNFGNGIADNNESNVLPNYEFVFSTGSVLDTLSVSGKVLRAFDLKPNEDPVFVMLYENLNDSAPLKEIPYYIGRTDKAGNYRINNIKSDSYRLFALKDENANFFYDLQKEPIGFIDSVLVLDAEKNSLSRDILIDTTYLKNYSDSLFMSDSITPDYVVDTISGDTIIVPKKFSYTLHADMFIFNEEVRAQFLTVKERVSREKLLFAFNRPLYDTLIIEPLNFSYSDDLFLKEISQKNDSVVFWITDTAIAHKDTLLVQLEYTVLDSLKNFTRRIDTLSFRFREPQEKKIRRRDQDAVVEDSVVIEKLALKTNIPNNGTMHLKGSLSIETEKPTFDFKSELVHLFRYEDSVEIEEKINLFQDTTKFRNFYIRPQWKETTSYRLLIEPGAFTDIYNHYNDTLDLKFTSQKLEYYGTLMLHISGIDEEIIIQLLDGKENVVLSKAINSNDSYKFDFLSPGSYRIKLIFDTNRNGKWDTGDYLKKIQPERVLYYKGTTDIKSNWDVEITWNITKTD